MHSAWADVAPACPPPDKTAISPCAQKPLSHWAQVLHWVPTPITAENLCGGYYFEPASITAYPTPLPLTEMQIDITSAGPALYSLEGNSSLQDNVIMLQPGRKIRADKATLIPNKETGKIEIIDLQGDVQFQEAGRLIVGKSAEINMEKGTLSAKKGGYHILRPAKAGPMDAWGTAEEAHRSSPTYSWFKRATYTTCTPTDPTWRIQSEKLILNKETGRGTAKDVVLYAKNTPFFYSPYLSFPIDKRRYSGFLYPNFGYDSQSGAFIGFPYYFNLAPNYDNTFTLTPMSQRGVMGENLFRYLTPRHAGLLDFSFLPNDRAFADFKNNIPAQYPENFYNQPFLNTLSHSSDNRGNVLFHNDTHFNTQWTSSADINYVTDDYYFQDMKSSLAGVSTDQLLNQASLAYQGLHWQFSSTVQTFQTLHPIDQTFILDQYQRLPALTLAANWPDSPHSLSYGFNSELVYFDHTHDFFTGAPYPTGSRFHFNPQISLPRSTSSAFFIPSLALDLTQYGVRNNGIMQGNSIVPSSNPDLNQARALPIFNLDGGLYFDRSLQLGKKSYSQTLEPRAFYLFVPSTDQNDIPIFDTTLPPFSFDELYRTNRFMGYDRMGDANQIAIGVTSRLLDRYTGAEKARASIGGIYYFRKQTVCLYPDCRDDPTQGDTVSPIAGELAYYLHPHVSMVGNAAWDPNNGTMNNDSVSLRYAPDQKRILNLSYQYIRNGDVLDPGNLDSTQNNMHRIDLSVSWPLTMHWSIVGDWNYNISHAHPQLYFYGLEYDTCCLAVRAVSSRILQAEDTVTGNTRFRSAYYLQFMLKGLGAVGANGGSNLLTSSIPGYKDLFST
jgi:LPS-assembly protein